MRYLVIFALLGLATQTVQAQQDVYLTGNPQITHFKVVYHQCDDGAAVASVLDDFHDAASKADGERYFNHFAENAIFLGTDITERWDLEAFKAYALPYFDQGRGWTYVPQARHIYCSPDGNTAWFDEIVRNERFGDTRGSGVLVKTGDAWKVAQYHLTLPIPNNLIYKVVEMIKQEDP